MDNEALKELGELIEGCLQEEGYQVEEVSSATASKFLAVRDRVGKEYSVSIIIKSKDNKVILNERN